MFWASLTCLAFRTNLSISVPFAYPLRPQRSYICIEFTSALNNFSRPSKSSIFLCTLHKRGWILKDDKILCAALVWILKSFQKRWKQFLSDPEISTSSVELKGLETWGNTKQVSTLFVAPIFKLHPVLHAYVKCIINV